MNKSKKAFFIMLAVLAATLAASGGGFYLADQTLQKSSKEISDLKADQEIIERQITIYEDARKKIEELSFIDDLANQVLPSTKEQAEIIGELRSFAETSSLAIQSIDFDSGNSLNTNLDTSQTQPATGIPGVLVLPVGVVFQSSDTSPAFDNFVGFLEKIEQNRRKMQITEISMTPSSKNPSVLSAASLSIEIFVNGGVPAPTPSDTAESEAEKEG